MAPVPSAEKQARPESRHDAGDQPAAADPPARGDDGPRILRQERPFVIEPQPWRPGDPCTDHPGGSGAGEWQRGLEPPAVQRTDLDGFASTVATIQHLPVFMEFDLRPRGMRTGGCAGRSASAINWPSAPGGISYSRCSLPYRRSRQAQDSELYVYRTPQPGIAPRAVAFRRTSSAWSAARPSPRRHRLPTSPTASNWRIRRWSASPRRLESSGYCLTPLPPTRLAGDQSKPP